MDFLDFLKIDITGLAALIFSIWTYFRHEKKINEQNQPLLWAGVPTTSYNKASGPTGDYTRITQKIPIKNIGSCPIKITCISSQLSVDNDLIAFGDDKILLLAPQEMTTIDTEFSTNAQIATERTNVKYQLQIHCEELKTRKKNIFRFVSNLKGSYDLEDG